jgi:hypothetical protein
MVGVGQLDALDGAGEGDAGVEGEVPQGVADGGVWSAGCVGEGDGVDRVRGRLLGFGRA